MSVNQFLGDMLNGGPNVVGYDLVPVTPDNSNDLATVGRAVRIRPDGAAGTVKFKTMNGQDRTTYMSAGEVLLVAVRRVYATGTTATNIEIIV